jgi:hypothetical protein
MNFRDVAMKYGHLIVIIRYDSAEIWGFRYGLTIGIGALKITASTGVFVHLVCAFRRSISSFSQTPSMIFTYLIRRKSHSNQKMGPERDFYKGRQRTEETERQPIIVTDQIKLNTKMTELVSGARE